MMTLKRCYVVGGAFLCAMVIVGCASQRAWRYSIDSYSSGREPILSKTVAVPPFRDSRPDENTNALLMDMVPLMPFGWADYSMPEAGNTKLTSVPVWQFKPSEDFAKAAAEELNASGLFKEVFFTYRSSEGDLILRGEIKSTHYWGKIITYGLSVYGVYLWFIGLPAGTVHNELAVEFSLIEQGTGSPLWRKGYNLSYHKSPFWIYSMPRDFDYDNLFKDMMRDVVTSLGSTLSKG